MRPERGLGGLRELRHLLALGGLRTRALLAPVLLLLGASASEAIAMVLLVPLTSSILHTDLRAARDDPRLRRFLEWCDGICPSSDGGLLALLVGLVVAFTLGRIALELTGRLRVATLLHECAHGLRNVLFRRYLTFGKSYFDQTSIGHLKHVLMGATHRIAGELQGLAQTIGAGLLLAAYSLVMLVISWPLTLLVLGSFPVLSTVMGRATRRLRRVSHQHAAAHRAVSHRSTDALANIELVKVHNAEAWEQASFQALSREATRLETSIDHRRTLLEAINQTLALGLLLTLLGLMALILHREGTGRLAGFVVFIYLLRRWTTTLGTFNRMAASLASLAGAISDVKGVLSGADTPIVPDGTREFPGLQQRIAVNNLSFVYDNGRPALDNLSCTIDRGRLTALVGPSGAGKSTLVRLLLRLYDCPPGTIVLDGVDIREFRIASLRARMALVSQETPILNDTLRRNLEYGVLRSLPDDALRNAARRARIDGLVRSLPRGFDTVLGDRGVTLSAGERQRVAIARAMLADPEILILDEATSALDSETERAVQEAVQEMVRDRTAIVIAHRLATISRADHILVLEKGQVVEEGTLPELLDRHQRFFEAWTAQQFS
jgi:subfamily B ATP-binding cassette protein MsbA